MKVYECQGCFELLSEPDQCPTCGSPVDMFDEKDLDVATDNVIDPYTKLYLDGSSPYDEDED